MAEGQNHKASNNGALTRIAEVLESAQFNNGSLDITLQGPESGWSGSPLVVKLYIAGDAVEQVAAELSEIATALHAVADAIGSLKCPS